MAEPDAKELDQLGPSAGLRQTFLVCPPRICELPPGELTFASSKVVADYLADKGARSLNLSSDVARENLDFPGKTEPVLQVVR
jgi:hypothetical protein